MHPAEIPLARIQQALGEDNPITVLFVQNPTDATGPRPKGVTITFTSRHFIAAMGNGNNVAEASKDLIRSIEEEKLCRCGHTKEECGRAS